MAHDNDDDFSPDLIDPNATSEEDFEVDDLFDDDDDDDELSQAIEPPDDDSARIPPKRQRKARTDNAAPPKKSRKGLYIYGGVFVLLMLVGVFTIILTSSPNTHKQRNSGVGLNTLPPTQPAAPAPQAPQVTKVQHREQPAGNAVQPLQTNVTAQKGHQEFQYPDKRRTAQETVIYVDNNGNVIPADQVRQVPQPIIPPTEPNTTVASYARTSDSTGSGTAGHDKIRPQDQAQTVPGFNVGESGKPSHDVLLLVKEIKSFMTVAKTLSETNEALAKTVKSQTVQPQGDSEKEKELQQKLNQALAQIESNTSEMEKYNDLVSVFRKENQKLKAQVKEYKGKNDFLRSEERKWRKLYQAAKDDGSKKTAKNKAVTKSNATLLADFKKKWKLWGLTSDAAIFLSKSDNTSHEILSPGDSLDGLTIKSIKPEGNYALTNLGKLFYEVE